MFGVSKKIKSFIAASLAELLIILAIVGILSVMYHRTVDNNAILVKYAYKNLINNMIEYASTRTNGYTTPINADTWDDTAKICNDFFETVNTIGESSCDVSNEFDLPNLVTTSGLRFFGLENSFSDKTPDAALFNIDEIQGLKYLIVKADLDGITGKNTEGDDVFAFELLQNGRIRPSGPAVTAAIKGNMARDPQLYSVIARIKVDDTENGLKMMGNRLSYAEAQCLSGNPFPYRATNGELQMCMPHGTKTYNERTVLGAIGVLENKSSTDTARADARETIRQYWLDLAKNGTVCKSMYTTAGSVTKTNAADKGLTPINDAVKGYCNQCYRAAYKAKYCQEAPTADNSGLSGDKLTKAINDFNANCVEGKTIFNETATCSTPFWAEYSEK